MSVFDRLSPGEREVIRLFAEGHTAKSVADRIGRSENAVNERLREARRKTGFASSRELARAWAAQENRDEENGAAPAAVPQQEVGRTPIPARMTLMLGVAAMLILTALFVALTHTGAPPAAATADAPAGDPLLAPLFVEEDASPLADLHRQVRAEARDTRWAPSTEALLRGRFAGQSAADAVRIRCAATLCEVAGDVGGSDVEAGSAAVVLQNLLLDDGVAALGLTGEDFAIGGPGGGAAMPFVFYLRRVR